MIITMNSMIIIVVVAVALVIIVITVNTKISAQSRGEKNPAFSLN